MSNKINFSELNKEIRKVLNFGDGDILIYEPTQEIVDEIIALQEAYYIENKTSIPKHILYMDVVPMLTNINLNIENELELQEIFEKPKLWLQSVLNEIELIIIEINRVKRNKIKNQLIELEELVKDVETSKEIPENVKEYFNKNKEFILDLGDKEFINSAKALNLIEVEEQIDEKEQRIKELEEELKRLKGVGV